MPRPSWSGCELKLPNFRRSLVTERPRVRQRVRGGSGVPPMPTLVPAELSEWIDAQHTDFQEAFSAGESIRVLVTG